MVDTLHPPPSVIASWPKPNYVNPDTRGPGLVYMCIIFAAFGIITCTARVYSRLFITKAPGLDDLLVVIALGFLTALTVLVIIGNKDYYNGRHVWDIPPDSFVGGRANIWASLWCYVIGITLIKISVLLFYRRLSVKFSRAFLIATWIGIIYNVLYFLSFGLTLLLLCNPLHAYWDSFNPLWVAKHHFHCGSESAALPASSAFSVAGDFYSTLLPLILVYYLELPRRQKIALYALFALGFMAVAAGLVRTVLMYNLLNVDYDFTWELWLTWIWAVLELYLALFAASAPSLKPFFRHFFVESINSFARGSRRRGEYGNNNSQRAAAEPMSRKGSVGGTGPYATEATKGDVNVDLSAADVERGRGSWEEPNERMESRQSWFLADNEDTGTKHFELRASQDGKKMIPMRVYKRSDYYNHNNDGYSGPQGHFDPFADVDDRSNYSNSHSATTALPQRPDWPLTLPTMGTEPQHEPREFLANPRLSTYQEHI
ncbi:uncharacterized protein Z520_03296 [Fonsecaea multimorphosa CBS 102226]|uniref:Rhodopsin domain-containing protein n=1 Tax=Fonsecaea multimorphosa CBS 102226 TaxID=1442371 RepID=A0A0D2K474_9EURO|nr:uncharacterized protein Z520_03296 [Fonsecaea multimorphosa CBS 102226]KIY00633.1 hypothetical protein Z520_03296 [Fonsecaea multimorphosa CBS 102226]OAL19023.1 hypothetical protein AYO22_10352 [Fonsecaea multimorphosa]